MIDKNDFKNFAEKNSNAKSVEKKNNKNHKNKMSDIITQKFDTFFKFLNNFDRKLWLSFRQL